MARARCPTGFPSSVRLWAVLSRIVSIYGDAERAKRLLDAHERPDNTAFMHLQTGLPAVTRPPKTGRRKRPTVTQTAPPETREFGVHLKVQRALANIRTDLDAFCDTEAWALMADAYQLTGRIVPRRYGHCRARPGRVARSGGASTPSATSLAQRSLTRRFLKLLQVGKERFLKSARMTPYVFATANVLIGTAPGRRGGWRMAAADTARHLRSTSLGSDHHRSRRDLHRFRKAIREADRRLRLRHRHARSSRHPRLFSLLGLQLGAGRALVLCGQRQASR